MGVWKGEIYVNRISNLEDLKLNICREMRSIAPDLLRKVMNQLTKGY